MLFLPLQEPLPAGRAPAGGVEIAAHRVAHDLELGADVGGLDQQLRLVIVGHEELHDAGAILRGRHAAVGIHEADPLLMTLAPWQRFCAAMDDLAKRNGWK